MRRGEWEEIKSGTHTCTCARTHTRKHLAHANTIFFGMYLQKQKQKAKTTILTTTKTTHKRFFKQ